MNWFGIAIACLRIASFIVQRVSINEGRKLQIADELIEIDRRIGITRKIVHDTNLAPEAELDAELRK